MSASNSWSKSILETSDIEHIPDLTADIERSMNKFFLNEFEEENDCLREMEKIVVPPLNPLMLHAIRLHQCANHIVDLIKLNENSRKTDKLDLKIPINMNTDDEKINMLNFTKQHFREHTPEGEFKVPELSKNIVKQILNKSVATVCAQIGYETSYQSAIDVLTDVLQDFLNKIAHHLQVTIRDEEERRMSGFPHAIERVLTEMGMGGVKGLNDYYQSQVIKYVNVLESRCKELNEEYKTLSVPKCPSPIDKINNVVRVKVEEEDVVEVENTEVHFSTIDGDVNFSILETGYQLLNSLEAEANLQSLGEGVEDMTVTESPGVVSVSTEDISHLSPYSKKKRFK